jgi:hypothetical protein
MGKHRFIRKVFMLKNGNHSTALKKFVDSHKVLC